MAMAIPIARSFRLSAVTWPVIVIGASASRIARTSGHENPEGALEFHDGVRQDGVLLLVGELVCDGQSVALEMVLSPNAVEIGRLGRGHDTAEAVVVARDVGPGDDLALPVVGGPKVVADSTDSVQRFDSHFGAWSAPSPGQDRWQG